MTRVTLAIGGVLLGVWLLITVALAVKALQNRLWRRAGAAVGVGRRIRVGLAMLPLLFFSAGALIVNAVSLLLGTAWYRARGKTVPWQDSGIPAASLELPVSKGEAAFYLEGQIVGRFLQDGAPSTGGSFPYEPHRGPGHFILQRELGPGGRRDAIALTAHGVSPSRSMPARLREFSRCRLSAPSADSAQAPRIVRGFASRSASNWV